MAMIGQDPIHTKWSCSCERFSLGNQVRQAKEGCVCMPTNTPSPPLRAAKRPWTQFLILGPCVVWEPSPGPSLVKLKVFLCLCFTVYRSSQNLLEAGRTSDNKHAKLLLSLKRGLSFLKKSSLGHRLFKVYRGKNRIRSHITCHTSDCRVSSVTCHMSYIMHDASCIKYQMSNI